MKRFFALILGLAIFYSLQAQHTILLSEVTFVNGQIKDYSGSATDILIPDNFDGVQVTSIGRQAFSGNGLTGVEIAGSVKHIELQAFSNNAIATVTFQSGVFYIGDVSFANNSISVINVPSSVTYIGDDAFNNNGASSITFSPGSNIRYIGKGAFSSNLTNLTLPPNANSGFSSYLDLNGNTYFASDVVTDNSTSYWAVLPTHTLTLDDVEFASGVINRYKETFLDIIIPAMLGAELVTGIEDYGFASRHLTAVQLPEGITSLGKSSFRSNYLKSISIPSTVNYIGPGAFNDNVIAQINGISSDGLIFARSSDGSVDNTTIVSYGGVSNIIDFIPTTVLTLGEDAFFLVGIKNLIIPVSVTKLGVSCFFGNDIESLFIPNGVRHIEQQAFSANSILSVDFEADSQLSYVGISIFSQNSGLAPVTLPIPVLEEGYQSFIGWFDIVNNVEMPVIGQAHGAIEARFELYNYALTYMNVGSLNNNKNPSNFTVEDEITLLSPLDSTDYVFSGWFTDELLINIVNIPAIAEGTTEDITFYAGWSLPTGIESLTESDIVVYPNPAQNIIAINADDTYLMRIVDINGREAFFKEVQKGMTTVDIGQYKAGLYILTMTNKNKVLQKIIMKQ